MTAGSATIVVDSSALLCVVNDEPGATEVLEKLMSADDLRISAATWTEVFIVADRREPRLAGILARFIDDLDIRVEPLTQEQAVLARAAYRDFGRRNHTAGLNYGDCFPYALTKDLGAELLYVGNDFSETDVRSALA